MPRYLYIAPCPIQLYLYLKGNEAHELFISLPIVILNYHVTCIPLKSNNSIELSVIVCVMASTIIRITMNPVIEIGKDIFLGSKILAIID